MSNLVALLHGVSWQAEKLFKARGHLRPMVWITENEAGRRQMFETACEVELAEISDAEALAVLRAELRADFAADGVVAYATAFPAVATRTLWPTALHLDSERRREEVVVIEAHTADVHLRGERAILRVAGISRLAALGPIEPVAAGCFGSLLGGYDERSSLEARSLPP